MTSEASNDCGSELILQEKFNKLKVLYLKQKKTLNESRNSEEDLRKQLDSFNSSYNILSRILKTQDNAEISLHIEKFCSLIEKLKQNKLQDEDKDYLPWEKICENYLLIFDCLQDQFPKDLSEEINTFIFKESNVVDFDALKTKLGEAFSSSRINSIDNSNENSLLFNLKKDLDQLKKDHKKFVHSWQDESYRTFDQIKKDISFNKKETVPTDYQELYNLCSEFFPEAEQNIKEYRRLLSDLKTNFCEKSKELDLYSRKVKTLNTELGEYASSCSIKTKEISQLKSVIRDLSLRNDELAGESEEHKKTIAQLMSKITEIQSDSIKLNDNLSELTKTKTQLEERLAEAESSTQEIQMKTENYERKVAELNSQLYSSENISVIKISDLEDMIENLKKENEILTSECTNISNQFSDYKIKAKAALSNKFDSDSISIKVQLEDLKNQNFEKDSEIDILKNKLEQFQSKYASMEDQLSKSQLKGLEDKRNYEEKIKSYEDRLNSHNRSNTTTEDLQRLSCEKEEIQRQLKTEISNRINLEKEKKSILNRNEEEIVKLRSKIKGMEHLYEGKIKSLSDRLSFNEKLLSKLKVSDETSKINEFYNMNQKSEIHPSKSNLQHKEASKKVKVTPLSMLVGDMGPSSFQDTITTNLEDLRIQLEKERNQNKILLETSNESEMLILTLTEESKVLKEEIRRLENNLSRSYQIQDGPLTRVSDGADFVLSSEKEKITRGEYLKNILLKFLSLPKSSKLERNELVPVLTKILSLSPKERSIFKEFADNGQSSKNLYEKWIVYETDNLVILVSSDYDETGFKMKRIFRKPTSMEEDNSEENATVQFESEEDRKWRLKIIEDPQVYSKTEIDIVFAKIKSQIQIESITNSSSHDCVIPQSKIVKSITGTALLGFIRFLRGYYLIMVTKSQEVAAFGQKKIFKIEELSTIYIPKNHLPSVYETLNMNIAAKSSGITSKLSDFFIKPTENSSKQTEVEELFHKDIMNEENRYLKLFQSVHLTNNFYYSSSYDLTNSLQNYILSGGECIPQDRFIWNLHFIPPKYKSSPMIAKIIQGFVRQDSVFMTGCPINITIIARRSAKYAGTRFLKRGCSLQGDVANEVETEQIASETRFSTFECNRMSSYVQIRGSVPVHWSQNPNKHVIGKPPIEYLKYDPFHETTSMHFSNLIKRFGGPIIILNLMKKKEKRPSEIDLSKRLLDTIKHLSQFVPKMTDETNNVIDPLIYLNFDVALVHKKCVNFTVLDKLHPIADQLLSLTGMFQHEGSKIKTNNTFISIVNELDKKFPILQKKKQFGVIRVNCVDCLDRTNTAQFIIGRCLLGYQMYQFGIIESPSAILNNSVLDKIVHNAYEELGDTIALQYGGSLLVHNIGTYRRTGKIRSQSRDFMQNLSRYYSNKFSDFEKQIAINLFLGIFRPGIQTRKEQLYSARRRAIFGENLAKDVKLYSLIAISYNMLEWPLENDSHVSWLYSWSELDYERDILTKWFNPRDLCFEKPKIDMAKFIQESSDTAEIKPEYTDLSEIIINSDFVHYMDVKIKNSICKYSENVEKSNEHLDEIFTALTPSTSLVDLSQATLDTDLIGLNRNCIDFDLVEEVRKDSNERSYKFTSIIDKFWLRDGEQTKKRKSMQEDENNSSEEESMDNFDDYLTIFPTNSCLFNKNRPLEIAQAVWSPSLDSESFFDTSISCENWFEKRIEKFYNFKINKKPDKIFYEYFDESRQDQNNNSDDTDIHVTSPKCNGKDEQLYEDYVNRLDFTNQISQKDKTLYEEHSKSLFSYKIC